MPSQNTKFSTTYCEFIIITCQCYSIINQLEMAYAKRLWLILWIVATDSTLSTSLSLAHALITSGIFSIEHLDPKGCKQQFWPQACRHPYHCQRVSTPLCHTPKVSHNTLSLLSIHWLPFLFHQVMFAFPHAGLACVLLLMMYYVLWQELDLFLLILIGHEAPYYQL